MRRLAKQSRDDVYASSRDYQTISHVAGQCFKASDGITPTLHLHADLSVETNARLIGFGGYFCGSHGTELTVVVSTSQNAARKAFKIGPDWGRVGLALENPDAPYMDVELAWGNGITLCLWGATAGALKLPEAISEANLKELNSTHLAPETFYLPHEGVLDIALTSDDSTAVVITGACDIFLKKCSYCGRQLPIDPERPGALAFHKHNAKRTNHQNECRACKKWRINDGFNPIRTVDQLHESSVITRERALFLRDPERLRALKDRDGAGLKSQVWKRFGRRCFYCGKKLRLGEVQLDHTRPLAYLWPIDEHATCLCADHNNQKKDKFPVDFYTPQQLAELSQIVGLPLKELQRRDINEVELQRILADLSTFAKSWEPRTFNATRRKVLECRPQLDLMDCLRLENPVLADELGGRLADRPPAVGEIGLNQRPITKR